ncbi:cytochrome b/b6 domain-containing protein [Aestuariibius sp. 2305UL40-4]|uniref:cytochrome b/b6 domain-containing protein n=1 Tax=Aestuariibius violaceus TaxID=3234132 RepID=UPI00345EBA57
MQHFPGADGWTRFWADRAEDTEMGLRNTDIRYGGIAKTFHWTVMLLIATLIPLGIYASNLAHLAEADPAAYGARAGFWFSLHKTLGIILFGVAVLRILWSLIQKKPVPLHPKRRVETFLAETVHWLLYASLILVPLAGWVSHAASTGFAPIWLPIGQDLPFVPKSYTLEQLAGHLHIIFERVLIFALALHVIGALKHHFIDRDATLRRMWFGWTELPQLSTLRPDHGRAPVIATVVVYVAALGIGAGLGMYDVSAAPRPDVAESNRASAGGNWAVEAGSLSITVEQFGSPVNGQFNDWTAEIEFDEGTGTGAVEVSIDIGSLTLGSVTQQAMGSDYFDVETHPRAVFDAVILPGEGDGTYFADGTLTLKGIEAPVMLPFTLSIADGTAQMQGETVLDRRNYGIGSGESDPGFEVGVTIELTARER